MINFTTIKDFFNILYSTKNHKQYILLWTPKRKRSHWLVDGDQAVDIIEGDPNLDYYFQVGLSDRDHGAGYRCKADESANRPVVAMPGIFADIDILSPQHKKKNLPSTIEDAKKIFIDLLPPTMIVNSGHGMHVYWLFHEMHHMPFPEHRERMTFLLTQLKNNLKINANNLGWDVDSVQDIARVLRVAGTVNYKNQQRPIPVTIESYNNEYRYSYDDLNNMLGKPMSMFAPPSGEKSSLNKDTIKPKVIIREPEKPDVIVDSFYTSITDEDIEQQDEIVPNPDGSLLLDSLANPPLHKFSALIEYHAKFRDTWHFSRVDLKDQTPSGYDIALTHILISEGWNDQEIANAIIAFRRNHNNDPKKALRSNYIVTLLAKCRQFQEQKQVNEKIQATTALLNSSYANITDKQHISDLIFQKHGIRILRFIRYKGDQNKYEIITDKGNIILPDIAYVTDFPKFKKSFADHLDIIIRKPKHWDDTAELIMRLVENVEISNSETVFGRVEQYLQVYLINKLQEIHPGEAARLSKPFVLNHQVYIFLSKFWETIRYQYAEDDARQRDVRKALYDLGCREKKKFQVPTITHKGVKPIEYCVWLVPMPICIQDIINKARKITIKYQEEEISKLEDIQNEQSESRAA